MRFQAWAVAMLPIYLSLHVPVHALEPSVYLYADTCITCQASSQVLIQAEPSVALHPTDPNIVLVTTNTFPDTSYKPSSVTASVSTDGGTTWTVFETGTGNNTLGDPACGITPNGRLLSQYIRGTQDGQDVAYSTNNGLTWTPVLAAEDDFFLDRGDLWVDPGSGWIVSGWQASGTLKIEAVYSLDNGANYQGRHAISDADPANESDFGPDFCSDPGQGETPYVYAAWSVQAAHPEGDEKGLGFATSFNGGLDWEDPVRITTVGPNSASLYVRGIWSSDLADGDKYQPVPQAGGRYVDRPAGSAPSIAVDQASGDIYLVWTNRGDPLSASPSVYDRNVYLIKSTDYGATWGLPVQVNQDTSATPAADHWFPRIAWDDGTGSLIVLYYDSRNHDWTEGDHGADTYVSVSTDGGESWEDHQVNRTTAVYTPIYNFANDYIGLAAEHGRAYAVWARDGELPKETNVAGARILLWGIAQSSPPCRQARKLSSATHFASQPRGTRTWM